MIHWPVIIKLHGDNELTFVANDFICGSDADFQGMVFDADDMLIDSKGRIYSLLNADSKGFEIRSTDRVMSTQEIAALVKGHAALVGSCCVAKLDVTSIPEAILLVSELSDK